MKNSNNNSNRWVIILKVYLLCHLILKHKQHAKLFNKIQEKKEDLNLNCKFLETYMLNVNRIFKTKNRLERLTL